MRKKNLVCEFVGGPYDGAKLSMTANTAQAMPERCFIMIDQTFYNWSNEDPTKVIWDNEEEVKND